MSLRTLICFVFFVSAAACKSQAPRFIFLDSLSFSLSPVSPVVVQTQNYVRTESYSQKAKARDTTSLVIFYYNNNGLTERTASRRRNHDSLVFTFAYDSFFRLVRRTVSSKGIIQSVYTADYSLDSIVRTKEVDSSGRLREARVMYYNKHLQLVKFELCDSSGSLSDYRLSVQ